MGITVQAAPRQTSSPQARFPSDQVRGLPTLVCWFPERWRTGFRLPAEEASSVAAISTRIKLAISTIETLVG